MKIHELSREQLERELKSRCVYCKEDYVIDNDFTATAGEYYHIVDNVEFVALYVNPSKMYFLDCDNEFKKHFERYDFNNESF